jgi:uncharacterized protein YaiL (DUF2058 family)
MMEPMQDLRDKLLKAGLIDKQQARKARTETRREKKKKSETQGEAEQALSGKQQYEARQREQVQKSRDHQLALNAQVTHQAMIHRLRNLIRDHQWQANLGRKAQPASERPFYFVGRDRKIRRLYAHFELASQLTQGKLAIVETDEDPRRDYAIIDNEGAAKLEVLDKALILFWNKHRPDPQNDLPRYGAGDFDVDPHSCRIKT